VDAPHGVGLDMWATTISGKRYGRITRKSNGVPTEVQLQVKVTNGGPKCSNIFGVSPGTLVKAKVGASDKRITSIGRKALSSFVFQVLGVSSTYTHGLI